MVAFKTIADLTRSLQAAELAADAAAIVATARPTLLFVREQADDDGLPVGTSKMGGCPDLPDGFAWPMRPAYADAQKRAARVRKTGDHLIATMTEWMTDPAKGRPVLPIELDEVRAKYEAKTAVLFAPFPLGFVAQLDLADLARNEGFDADLPRTGMLSIFEDLTGDAEVPRAFWHQQPAATCKRTPFPTSLIAHYDIQHSWSPPLTSETWAQSTKAEVLTAYSAITVPHHWKNAYPGQGPKWTQIWNWFDKPAYEYSIHELPDKANAANFGDRLGGWPDNIQGNPEDELPGETARTGRIIRPGVTPWRHLFSYGGEFWQRTRHMKPEDSGDGNTFVMIRDADLAARRFEKAGSVYQQT